MSSNDYCAFAPVYGGSLDSVISFDKVISQVELGRMTIRRERETGLAL